MYTELAKEVFERIIASKSRTDLEKIFDEFDFNRRNTKKYPSLSFTITQQEIKSLKKEGLITTDDCFSTELSNGRNMDALSKLLYSILWKNGDLQKEKHIIQGILGQETDRIVFNQFGKHLNDKNEPLVDQHVIRAFNAYTGGRPIEDNVNTQEVIAYKQWLEKYDIVKNNKDIVDEILFVLGQKLKDKKE